MACLSQRLHTISIPSLQLIRRPCLQIRAHSCKDEGTSGRLVDANLNILRERIKVVKMREKLEAYCRSEMGWNYSDGYAKKPKFSEEFSTIIQLFGWAIGSFGFTIGSLCLALISFLVYFNQ